MITRTNNELEIDAVEMQKLIISSLSDIPEGTEKSFGNVAVEIACQRGIVRTSYMSYCQLPAGFLATFNAGMQQLIAEQRVRFLTDCDTPEYGRIVRLNM